MAAELAEDLYRVTADGPFSKSCGRGDQIRCAAVSVMSNLAEGFDRASRNEFSQFPVFAKGSCAQLRSQPVVVLDAEYLL